VILQSLDETRPGSRIHLEFISPMV
jgi:hypothetical protein